jgi:hypothetical protein
VNKHPINKSFIIQIRFFVNAKGRETIANEKVWKCGTAGPSLVLIVYAGLENRIISSGFYVDNTRVYIGI